MPSRCCEFVDSRLRRSPPDRASAVPMDKPGKTRCVSPTLPTGRRLLHKLHSTPQQHGMILISGNGEITSRLYAFSLFFPGSCPNNRDRRRGGRTLVGSRCRPVTRSGGVRRECGVSPFRMSRRPPSSLHGGHLGELRDPANRSRKTRCNTQLSELVGTAADRVLMALRRMAAL